MDLLSDPQFVFHEPKNSCECDWCMRQWKFCCCKVFIPVSIIAITVIGLLFVSGYFPLRQYADSPLELIHPVPTQVSGTSDIIINMTSTNLLFSRSVTITTNCSGSVYFRSHSNCSGLPVANISTEPTPELHYLLKGSLVKVQYETPNLNCFVIIKSLEGYAKYVDLCRNISSHQECQRSESKVVAFICSNKGEGDLKCYKSENTKVHSILINETDFYYFSIPMYPGPFYSKLVALSYDKKVYVEEGFSATNLTWDESSDKYEATLFLPGRWWLHHPDNCIILSTDCPTKTEIYSVQYKLNFDSRFYNCLHIVVGSLCVIALLVVCIFQVTCYIHRKGRTASDQGVNTFIRGGDQPASAESSVNVI